MYVDNDFSVIVVDQPNGNNEEIIKATFKNVDVVTNQEEAMLSIMSRKDHTVPILLLIDVDFHFCLLEKVCQSIQYSHLINIIPIACSKNDSYSLMIQCIQTGASDFVLKPFREPVMKTMFLNVYRHKIDVKPKEQSKISILSRFQDRLEFISKDDDWLSENVLKQYTSQRTTERRSILDLTSERQAFLRGYVCDWNFSPLDLDELDLVHCVYIMLDQTFEQLSELNPLRMDKDVMYDFIFDVCNSYHNSNPYHNFKHAVDVMQSTWYTLCSIYVLNPIWWPEKPKPTTLHEKRLKDLLRPIDVLALLMASLGHDVGHPGVNNCFMVTTATPLAVLYNDKSVLESYHAMAFFKLLCKYFRNANIDVDSCSEYKEFRRVVVHSILCTDMGCHQDYLASIIDTTKRMRNHTIYSEEEERLVLCSAIMKCADISNCTRPFDIAKRWAVILAEEFSMQGDLEKELGIPSLPIHERGKVSLPDFQLYFMKNVALDLYASFGQLFPEMKYCTENIKENIKTWEGKKQA